MEYVANQLKGQLSGVARLLQLMRGQKVYALALFGVMVIAALMEGFGLSLVLPLLSGLIGLEMETPFFSKILDVALAPVPDDFKLEGVLGLLVIVFATKSVLMILQTGMTVNYALKLRSWWASRVFMGYLKAPYEQIIDQAHGTLVNNTIYETLNASAAVTMILRIFSKLIVSATLLFLLVITDATMVMVVAAAAGLIMYGVWNATHRYSIRFGKERLQLSQQTVAAATESLGAIREVKILGVADRNELDLQEKLNRYKRVTTNFKVLAGLPVNLGEFVVIIFIATLLTVVHLTREESIKEFIPLLGFFVLVSQRLLVYVSFIISQRMNIVAMLPSVELIHSLLFDQSTEQEDSPSGQEPFTRLESDIELKGLRLSHKNGKRVFDRLEMTIPLGKMVGLIGPSGSGKSTVADLLLRLLEPQGGQITVNGRDLRDWELQSWRGKIGYVSQELFIFNASIRDNILMGRPSASEDDMRNAAKLANADEFIEELPNGYDTVVGDRGVKLSGGQKQRVAIARAIIRNPELYIFDEATSALDQDSERLIQRAIEKVSHTKTSLVIAHRLSTLKDADVIYELTEDGEARLVTQYHLRARSLG
ncbi:MAG: ABC transporter ATP-binding protein [Rhodothermia bacterium]|nr:MAG: ABC transporter ATP-binding protein [Rhodothermia bacterium]